MAFERGVRPLCQHLRCTRHDRITLPIRYFTISARRHEVESPSTTPESPPLDPNLVFTRQQEQTLLAERKLQPIGSRRRRAALNGGSQIPFEQLPYQCFQEARKILQQDREEKLAQINELRKRIEKAMDQVAVGEEEQKRKEHRLEGMRYHLEELKVFADINDPLVKKRFEDGQGDLSKPVYRHLADQKWRSYKRKILMQRIEQMNVVPDVMPAIDPTVEVSVSFPTAGTATGMTRARRIAHGDFVDARTSERAPILDIQPFDRGERLVSIAVVTPDVPDVASDGFAYRCHFLATNVALSPTRPRVALDALDPAAQVLLPWLPPYAQKGAPYHRMSVFVLQHPATERVGPAHATVSPSRPLDVAAIRADARYTTRENFILRSFATKYALQPVGVDLFRTLWDDGTAGVMQRAGIVGADVEFKPKRIEPLPYQRQKGEKYR